MILVGPGDLPHIISLTVVYEIFESVDWPQNRSGYSHRTVLTLLSVTVGPVGLVGPICRHGLVTFEPNSTNSSDVRGKINTVCYAEAVKLLKVNARVCNIKKETLSACRRPSKILQPDSSLSRAEATCWVKLSPKKRRMSREAG